MTFALRGSTFARAFSASYSAINRLARLLETSGISSRLTTGTLQPRLPAARRRRLGVDSFRKGTEFHATFAQVVEHGYQVAQAAASPVEFPDDEGVTGPKFFQAIAQDRAVATGSRALLGKDVIAFRLLQGVHLKRRVLVFGADVGVIVFHG